MRYIILFFVLISFRCESQIPGIIASTNKSSGCATASYTAESLTVFSNIESGSGETLNNCEKLAINRYVSEQVAKGNWNDVYSFIPLSGLETSGKALVDWITGTQATTVGSPTYSPYTGFTTNGTTSYVDTGVNPSTINGGAAVGVDDIFYNQYTIENLGTSVMGVIGTTSTRQVLISVTDAGVANIKVHTDVNTNFTDDVDLGHDLELTGTRRTNSSTVGTFRNCQRTENTTLASKGVPAGRTIYVGAVNNNGTADSFAASRYGAFILSESIAIDGSSFFYHFDILMQELGVKPKSPLYYPDLVSPTYTSSDAFLLNSEGQSNGMFCGGNSVATLVDAELIAPIANANTYWKGLSLSLNPIQIQTLEYNTNNSYDHLNGYGSGLRAAFEITNRQSAEFYIWHYDISGTGLAASFTTGWYPDLVSQLFDKSNDIVGSEGLALTTEPIKKIVFHWSQGEGDANIGRTTAEYKADFLYFLKSKIDFYEAEGLNLSVAKLHVIVAKIYVDAPYSTTADIRAAQDQFTIADLEAAYAGYGAKVTSMTVYDNDDLVHTDLVHMDNVGYFIEGYRLGLFMSKL